MIKQKKHDAIVGEYYLKGSPDYFSPKWHISIEDPIVAFLKKGKIKGWESKGVSVFKGERIVWIRGYDFDSSLLKKSKH